MTDYTRIMDPARAEHYVYRLYDNRGHLLYIGCTMNLKGRLKEHRHNGKFGHYANAEAEGPFNYQDGRRHELAAILAEQPKHNNEWRKRTFGDLHMGRPSATSRHNDNDKVA